jgi:methylmalonyl-CoA mutase, N-terminal domain
VTPTAHVEYQDIRRGIMKKDLRVAQRKWSEGIVNGARLMHGERKKVFYNQSGMEIKDLYTPADLEAQGFDYEADLGFPGQFPYTRGRDPLGYRKDFWIFQQYAGFGDAEEANRRYRFLLEGGQTGISIALDLPTQVGLDSDDPLAEGEVGKIGVAIDSLEDLEILFQGIPLNKPRQISFVANAMSVVGLAMFVALAEKQELAPGDITIRIQNDILKEFIARGAYIFPPGPSVRLACDLITYCTDNCPTWKPLTICGYHIRESGATATQEVAFSLANGMAYLDHLRDRGCDISKVLPQLSAFMCVNTDFFEEIAKFRALRRLWAKLFSRRYEVEDLSKLIFDIVAFTAGSSLTAQQPMNNVVRVTLECLAAALGGCQSLFPCSMDEAFSTPTEQAVKIALRTQQIIAHETGAADTIDPLGGSYYLETLTCQMEKEVEKYLDEVDAVGGAIRAIEKGYFQRKIEESSYKLQRAVESDEKIIVGLNKYRENETVEIPIFRPPEETARKQKEKLKKLRSRRDSSRVGEVLLQVEKAAESGENVVPVLIEAVKAYATVGEICGAFRRVFGEYTEKDF